VRAARLVEFGRPLEVGDAPEPEPADGEILVRVRGAGLCGTDLKLVDGKLPNVSLPMTPGHEIAGEVVHDPTGAHAPGAPVACYFYESCGHCRLCKLGQTTICRSVVRLGIERNGGLGEFVSMPGANAVPLPDGVSFEVAAVAMDSVLTPWRALRGRGAVRPGEFVVVVGSGGLGLNGVQIASDGGARVAAVDVDQLAREMAVEVGAELAVAPDHVGELVEWSGGGADLVLDTSGSPAGFETGVAALRPGGRLVGCGYQPGVKFSFESMRLPLDELTILGSRVGSVGDAADALDAVARGAVIPTVSETIGLEDVNEGLRRLRAGEVVGRLAVNPEG
jgi:D-arabinose 1-dehydrogenase-like Zn-dependent alcohol dehydrogenase